MGWFTGVVAPLLHLQGRSRSALALHSLEAAGKAENLEINLLELIFLLQTFCTCAQTCLLTFEPLTSRERERSAIENTVFRPLISDMELIRRRLFSTTARQQFNRAHYDSLKPSLATPAPTSHGPVLSSPELEQLAAKAKGSWKEFTKEEAVQCK